MIWTSQVGDNAVVPALAAGAQSWVVSVVEFPGVDLQLLRQQQAAAASRTQQALTADLVEPLQESFLVGLDVDGDELWRLAVPQPVVGLVALDGGVVAALDVDGNLFALDAASGAVLDEVRDVVPSRYAWGLTGGGSDLLVGGCVQVAHARWTRGAFEVVSDRHRLCFPNEADGQVVFTDEVGTPRIAAVDALGSSRAIGDPGYSSGVWLVRGGEYVVYAPETGDVVVYDVIRGEQVALLGPTRDISYVLPSADGSTYVLSGGGRLDRWVFDQGELRRRACEIVGRDLTAEEWARYLSDPGFVVGADAAGNVFGYPVPVVVVEEGDGDVAGETFRSTCGEVADPGGS